MTYIVEGEELRGFLAGIDSRVEITKYLMEINSALQTISDEWNNCRDSLITNSNLPITFISVLDDIADIIVCEEKGCLARPHKDWDFCKEHGKVK